MNSEDRELSHLNSQNDYSNNGETEEIGKTIKI
jgi:hypothetical protein